MGGILSRTKNSIRHIYIGNSVIVVGAGAVVVPIERIEASVVRKKFLRIETQMPLEKTMDDFHGILLLKNGGTSIGSLTFPTKCVAYPSSLKYCGIILCDRGKASRVPGRMTYSWRPVEVRLSVIQLCSELL